VWTERSLIYVNCPVRRSGIVSTSLRSRQLRHLIVGAHPRQLLRHLCVSGIDAAMSRAEAEKRPASVRRFVGRTF
jgi:hypothetical protein